IDIVHHHPKCPPRIRRDRDPPSPIRPRRRRVAAPHIQRPILTNAARASHHLPPHVKRVDPVRRDHFPVVLTSHQQRSRLRLALTRPGLIDTNKPPLQNRRHHHHRRRFLRRIR